MKYLVCSLLVCIILICSICHAESLDLNSFTVEQLEALQQMINNELESKQDQNEAQYTDCISLLEAMISAGAIIDSGKMLDLTAETDPNELLGTIGSYSSKTDFGCVGYASNSEGYVGGTIEYFPEAEYAQNRFSYLKQLYISMPSFADKSMYISGKYVLRLDDALSTEEVVSIVSIFEAQLGKQIDDMFDPQSKITLDLLHGNSLPNAAGDTAASIEDAIPASSVIPTATVVPDYQTLQRGSKGTNVAKLQSRLKSIGFLTGLADGDFGPATEQAVKAFQTANGLDATGIATPNDQVILFDSGVICADGSIAKAYDPYEVCPVELSRVDLKKSYGYNYVTFTAKNISTQDVKAVNCSVRYFDAFGDRITEYGTNEITVSIADIAVGKSVSISTKDDYTMFVSDAASAEVAVTRVLMSDGTNLDYFDPVWFEGK